MLWSVVWEVLGELRVFPAKSKSKMNSRRKKETIGSRPISQLGTRTIPVPVSITTSPRCQPRPLLSLRKVAMEYPLSQVYLWTRRQRYRDSTLDLTVISTTNLIAYCLTPLYIFNPTSLRADLKAIEAPRVQKEQDSWCEEKYKHYCDGSNLWAQAEALYSYTFIDMNENIHWERGDDGKRVNAFIKQNAWIHPAGPIQA